VSCVQLQAECRLSQKEPCCLTSLVEMLKLGAYDMSSFVRGGKGLLARRLLRVEGFVTWLGIVQVVRFLASHCSGPSTIPERDITLCTIHRFQSL
jgi:hypothetical protein